jgi:hypothetical protein
VSGLNVEPRRGLVVAHGGWLVRVAPWYLASRIGRHGPAVRLERGDDHLLWCRTQSVRTFPGFAGGRLSIPDRGMAGSAVTNSDCGADL